MKFQLNDMSIVNITCNTAMVYWIDGDRNSANEAPVKAANLATTVNNFYVKIYPFFVNVFSKSVLFPLCSCKCLQNIS